MADLNQQAGSETELRKVLESFAKVKAYFSNEVVAQAQGYVETFTCPMHRDVVGKRTDLCPKCGMPLDQVSRILPSGSNFLSVGQQTVRASVSTAAPLTVGEPVAALLKLQRSNGDPVLPSDLIETHTKKVHLLIVDSSLTDYHHEHPVLTRNPGEYSFSFTPGKPGSYRVWADVRPYPLGLQEYAMTDIPRRNERRAADKSHRQFQSQRGRIELRAHPPSENNPSGPTRIGPAKNYECGRQELHAT